MWWKGLWWSSQSANSLESSERGRCLEPGDLDIIMDVLQIVCTSTYL